MNEWVNEWKDGWMNEYGALVKGKTEALRGTTWSVQVLPHVLDWNSTQFSAVKGWRLAASATTQPSNIFWNWFCTFNFRDYGVLIQKLGSACRWNSVWRLLDLKPFLTNINCFTFTTIIMLLFNVFLALLLTRYVRSLLLPRIYTKMCYILSHSPPKKKDCNNMTNIVLLKAKHYKISDVCILRENIQTLIVTN